MQFSCVIVWAMTNVFVWVSGSLGFLEFPELVYNVPCANTPTQNNVSVDLTAKTVSFEQIRFSEIRKDSDDSEYSLTYSVGIIRVQGIKDQVPSHDMHSRVKIGLIGEHNVAVSRKKTISVGSLCPSSP